MFKDSDESLLFRSPNYRVESTFIVFKFKFFLLYELLHLHIMALHQRRLSNCRSEDYSCEMTVKPKLQLTQEKSVRKVVTLDQQNPGENPYYTVQHSNFNSHSHPRSSYLPGSGNV